MKHFKTFEDYTSEFSQDDEDEEYQELVPISGNIDSPIEGTPGLEQVFSPLEEDMIEDWNNDKNIQKWSEENRIFLQKLTYDSWAIWCIEGDRQVKKYIMKNFSW